MKEKVRHFFARQSIVIILVVVLIYAVFGVRGFTTARNLSSLLSELGMYGIAAIGMSFILINGDVDLSMGMNIALGAIVSSLLCSAYGPLIGICAAILACILVSLVNGLLITRVGINSLITTIATMTALNGLNLILGNGKTAPLTNEFVRGIYSFKLFGISILSAPILLFIIFLIGGALVLRKTSFGASVYVVGGNAEAGRMSGINTKKVKLICFLIGGLCTGICGILLSSYVYGGSVMYGSGLNLTIVSACVLGGVRFTGGKGGMLQTLLGMAVIRLIINIMSLLAWSSAVQNIMTGALLVVVLIIDRLTNIKSN